MIDTVDTQPVRTLVVPRYNHAGNFIGRYVYEARLVANSNRNAELLPLMCEVETWGQQYGQPNTVITAWEAIVGTLSKLPENKHLGTVRKLVKWQLPKQDKPTAWAAYHGGSFTNDQSRGHFYFGGAGGSFFHVDCKLITCIAG